MNDFTKDELEEIQEIARHCCKQAVETRHNLTYTVKLKAERMIDNYCEHESDGVAYSTNLELKLPLKYQSRCLKCGEWFK